MTRIISDQSQASLSVLPVTLKFGYASIRVHRLTVSLENSVRVLCSGWSDFTWMPLVGIHHSVSYSVQLMRIMGPSLAAQTSSVT